MRLHILRKEGLSLIEIVIVIIILSIAMLPLLVTYANVINKGMSREAISVVSALATELMEEIESKRYDENPDPPWTQKQNLGVDGVEDSTNKDTFNDVDDFKGYSKDPISDEFPGYSVQIEVYYVHPEDLNEHQNPDPTILVTDYTDFKKIVVTVSHEEAGNIELVSVMGGY
ncbi:MAG: prepilin-type N-terminal cleavage/methylation domain-containing protein [Candidatus Omnitrophica bacterium]|nr:prepilin-type N-terminal cleavage/methylation domain-containing protein [Candidatus Omnitrophota bacterium]